VLIREPIVAGQFYPADGDECRTQLSECLRPGPITIDADARLVGGLVPHAGWSYSGAVAGKVFAALASLRSPKVVILFGGVHRFRGRQAAMFGNGRWETPIGSVTVDERLSERILGHTNLIISDPYAHEQEHSIEVQVPFVKQVFPEAKIVPIMVPPVNTADEVGEAVGRTLRAYEYDALIVGTTDLTHYGPRYGFAPQGIGAEGIQWAKAENDTRFIDLVCSMKMRRLVIEAEERKNACSSGAAAATLAAATALGARRGVLLEHTSSAEVMARRMQAETTDSVGYAGVVFE
jgi:hypothetical protein